MACTPTEVSTLVIPTSSKSQTLVETIYITATNTLLPEPTSTLTPTVIQVTSILEGTIFFDMDRSGVQDVATYFDAYNNELISQVEPGLSGYEVCALVSGERFCSKTNSSGNYSILGIPVKSGTKVSVKIVDPNAGVAELEMRYINITNGTITIPEYKMNGYYVLEQILSAVARSPISDEIHLETGIPNSIGLMQGFILWPNSKDVEFQVFSWFDLDPNVEKVKNFVGDTTFVESFFPTELTRTTDQHIGMDINYSKGDFIRASAEGIVVDITSQIVYDDGRGPELAVEIHHGNGFLTTYRHLDAALVEIGEQVFPSQIIGAAGLSGMNPGVIAQVASDFGLLHWDFYRDVPDGQGTQLTLISSQVDVFRDETGDFTPLSSDISYLTYDNHPVFASP